MDNDKYYVVTNGYPSDYSIIAVTTDFEIAEKIATKFSTRYDEPRIEEYGDAMVMLRPAWMIYFDRAGNVISTRECDCAYDYSRIGECLEGSIVYSGFNLRVTVSADDVESAVKIAAEKRAEYLAEKLGV